MANVNGIHHVIRSELEPGEGKKAYCGRTVYRMDMPIMLDHARLCVEQDSYVQPCKNCMKKANKQGE